MIRNLKLVDLEPAAVMTLRCTAKTVPENPFFASLAAAIDCALENRPDKRAEPQIFVGKLEDLNDRHLEQVIAGFEMLAAGFGLFFLPNGAAFCAQVLQIAVAQKHARLAPKNRPGRFTPMLN
jgi:hypothetical protein